MEGHGPNLLRCGTMGHAALRMAVDGLKDPGVMICCGCWWGRPWCTSGCFSLTCQGDRKTLKSSPTGVHQTTRCLKQAWGQDWPSIAPQTTSSMSQHRVATTEGRIGSGVPESAPWNCCDRELGLMFLKLWQKQSKIKPSEGQGPTGLMGI